MLASEEAPGYTGLGCSALGQLWALLHQLSYPLEMLPPVALAGCLWAANAAPGSGRVAEGSLWPCLPKALAACGSEELLLVILGA